MSALGYLIGWWISHLVAAYNWLATSHKGLFYHYMWVGPLVSLGLIPLNAVVGFVSLVLLIYAIFLHLLWGGARLLWKVLPQQLKDAIAVVFGLLVIVAVIIFVISQRDYFWAKFSEDWAWLSFHSTTILIGYVSLIILTVVAPEVIVWWIRRSRSKRFDNRWGAGQ